MIFSFSFALFLTGESIGWRFERTCDPLLCSLNIQAGIIGITLGWRKSLPPVANPHFYDE